MSQWVAHASEVWVSSVIVTPFASPVTEVWGNWVEKCSGTSRCRLWPGKEGWGGTDVRQLKLRWGVAGRDCDFLECPRLSSRVWMKVSGRLFLVTPEVGGRLLPFLSAPALFLALAF